MAMQVGERTFEERMYDLLDVTEYRRMETGEDREAAYRLRYDAYRREGYVEDDPEGKTSDFVDEKPNTLTIGVYIAGKLCSSIRVSVLTKECPFSCSMISNAETIWPMLMDNQVLIDPSRFVADAAAAREFPELPYLTMRIPSMACEHYMADQCLAAVRREHHAFYRRIFRSKPIADPVRYKLLKFDIQLMSTTVQVIRDDVAKRYPFFQSDYLERRQLFGASWAMPGIEEGRTSYAKAA